MKKRRERHPHEIARVIVCGSNTVIEKHRIVGHDIDDTLVKATKKAKAIWDSRDKDQWGQTRIAGIRIDLGDCEADDWVRLEKVDADRRRTQAGYHY